MRGALVPSGTGVSDANGNKDIGEHRSSLCIWCAPRAIMSPGALVMLPLPVNGLCAEKLFNGVLATRQLQPLAGPVSVG